MFKNFATQYGRAFFEILFIRPYPSNADKFKPVGKVFVYLLAFALFYLPILYFVTVKCIENKELTAYFAIIVAIHVLAKFMLCSSKKVQKRFSTTKQKPHFLMRTWFILEYVVFMWLVYLFYPLTCILFPLASLAMAIENFLGYSTLFNFFLQNIHNFIFVGGIISYVLFIIADGFRKLRSGFLPDYLGLYAVLTIVSVSLDGITQKFVEVFSMDISALITTLSWVFSIGNNSMSIVGAAVTLCFAIRSLYANCGTGEEDDEDGGEETEIVAADAHHELEEL